MKKGKIEIVNILVFVLESLGTFLIVKTVLECSVSKYNLYADNVCDIELC